MKKSRTSPKLDADKSLRSNLRTLLRSAADNTFSQVGLTMKACSPDAVHDARVAARRLRALMKIFRSAFPRRDLKRLLRTLSLLIQSLGRVRDRDIIIENLNAVRHVLSREGQRSIDLLISKQRASRRKYAASLGNIVRNLASSDYRSSLRSFIESSLT